MKKLIYLLTVITLFVSCEKESADELTNDQGLTSVEIKESDAKSSSIPCAASSLIMGPAIVTPDSDHRYTFIDSETNQLIRFSISERTDDNIWGTTAVQTDSNGNLYADINFSPNFTCGTIFLDYLDGCSVSFVITTNADDVCSCIDGSPAPSIPGPITFDNFLGTNPTSGDFCINTTANVLLIDEVPCAADYIWSISPTVFGTELDPSPINKTSALLKVSQPGEYVVSVRAISSNGDASGIRSITLTAENCFGGGF
ncbi:hypothetical protein [Aquimarina algiphila]|uniref:hypothetical protein n=1 Tax=Aquimarina algiphila TaxID=2047982 RepID=UPI00232D85C4|nr:hypothetical protein [Aquimarina algiphila]